jgi:membrane protein implicated in regulation of membrane protease activity
LALLALLEHLLLQTPLQAVLAATVAILLSIFSKRLVDRLVKAEALQHQVH